MASPKVSGGAASAATLKGLLDSPEVGHLIETLEATRWTGRPGYSIRTLTGLALAKSLYALPTWTKVVALVADHWKLQRVLACEGNPPSQWAAYRFAAKLRENNDALQRCIDGVVEGLKAKLPLYGRDLAIDASDMPAYANGQRYVYKGGPERNWHTDPDASWGHRSAVATRKGGGFFGYRLHAAVCTATDLPVAWTVETGKANEVPFVAPLLDTARRRGAMAATAALDRGYDHGSVYATCMERDCLPVIPLRQTPDVKRGAHRPPACQHGVWSATPDFQAALGKAVQARRKELDLTQEELALRSALHQRWISNVETGKRNPSYASLRRLAEGLGFSASDLLARAERIEAGAALSSNG